MANLPDLGDYQVFFERQYVVVKPSMDVRNDSGEKFQSNVDSIVKDGSRHFVLNCCDVSELSQSWIYSLLTVVGMTDSSHKVAVVMANDKIKGQLKENSLGDVQVFKTIRDALIALGIVKRSSLDVQFVNPFLAAIREVLHVQAKTEAIAGQVRLKTSSDQVFGDISGAIGIISDSFTGSIILTFPEATFLTLMSRIVGNSYTSITKEIEDGAAELTNVISGIAKGQLNQKGYGIKSALPSIIRGNNHLVSATQKDLTVLLPFETDAGPFFVLICLSN